MGRNTSNSRQGKIGRYTMGLIDSIAAQALQDGLGGLWKGGKRRRNRRMSRENPDLWRAQEVDRIHKEAVRMAGMQSDRYLRKHGRTRADAIRIQELLLRARRGDEMSQPLLDDMDISGLDLSRVRKGALSQEHIDGARGNGGTVLPPSLVALVSLRTATTPSAPELPSALGLGSGVRTADTDGGGKSHPSAFSRPIVHGRPLCSTTRSWVLA